MEGKGEITSQKEHTKDLEKVAKLIENKVKTSVSQMEGVTKLDNVVVESLTR